MGEPGITVYCSKSCPPCHALCQWLDSIGLAYKKVVYGVDKDFPSEIRHLPTIEVEGERMPGHSRAEVIDLLNRHKYATR